MTKNPQHLRTARALGLITAMFALLANLAFLASIIWFLGALFGDWSWLASFGFFLAAMFCNAVRRNYSEAWQKELEAGVAAGDILIDENNVARGTTDAYKQMRHQLLHGSDAATLEDQWGA